MFSGDIAAIGRLAQNIRRLAEVPSQVASGVSGDIHDLIEEEFDGQADPYGNAWAAHKPATVERWGEHDILDLDGAMRGGVDVSPMSGAGVAITFDAPYAGFHHSGTGAMAARPVLPVGTFPARWEEAISAATERRIRATLGE